MSGSLSRIYPNWFASLSCGFKQMTELASSNAVISSQVLRPTEMGQSLPH
jgi:hypothetical protein